jgi:hypothetical protein
MKTFAWASTLFVLMAGAAFAQEAAAPASTGFNFNNLWQMAILGALTTTILGKAKSGDFKFTELKEFDIKKIGMKAIVGLVVGLVASIKGISLADSETFLFGGDGLAIGSLIVFGVDYLLRAIFKASAIPVRKLLGLDVKTNPPAAPTDQPTPTAPQG